MEKSFPERQDFLIGGWTQEQFEELPPEQQQMVEKYKADRSLDENAEGIHKQLIPRQLEVDVERIAKEVSTFVLRMMSPNPTFEDRLQGILDQKTQQYEGELQNAELRQELIESVLISISYQVRVSAIEALINNVKHGHRGDPRLKVEGFYGLNEEGAFVFHSRDEGFGFDPATVPDPTAPENLDKPTGRGLLLQETYMDKREVGFEGSRRLLGTSLNMLKRLPVLTDEDLERMLEKNIRKSRSKAA